MIEGIFLKKKKVNLFTQLGIMVKPGNLLHIIFTFFISYFFSHSLKSALDQMGNHVQERFDFLGFQLLKRLIKKIISVSQCAELGMFKKALDSLKITEKFISKQIQCFLIVTQKGLFLSEQKLIPLLPQTKEFSFQLKKVKVIFKELDEHKKKNCLCFSEQQFKKCKEYIQHCEQLENILFYSQYKIQSVNFLKERSQELKNSTELIKSLDLIEKKRKIFEISASQSLSLSDKGEQIIKEVIQIKNNLSKKIQRFPSKLLKQHLQIEVKKFFNEIKQINMQVKGLSELEMDIYENIKD